MENRPTEQEHNHQYHLAAMLARQAKEDEEVEEVAACSCCAKDGKNERENPKACASSLTVGLCFNTKFIITTMQLEREKYR